LKIQSTYIENQLFSFCEVEIHTKKLPPSQKGKLVYYTARKRFKAEDALSGLFVRTGRL
jgi:hypothetical protein